MRLAALGKRIAFVDQGAGPACWRDRVGVSRHGRDAGLVVRPVIV